MNTIITEERKNYIIARLDRGKANPINQEMMAELRQLLEDVKASDQWGGVILTGKEHYFSAGLDVVEMYAMDEMEIRQFFTDFRALVNDLIKFPKPLIAAITGHSPAGGCVMASCCDYRVMAQGEYIIGFNEVPVGLVVTTYIFEMFKLWVGDHRAYQFTLEGKLLKASEALEVGLVDAVVPFAEVLAKAEAKIQKYLSFSPIAWQQSKMHMRKTLIEAIDDEPKVLMEQTMKLWWEPSNRIFMKKLVDRISAGK